MQVRPDIGRAGEQDQHLLEAILGAAVSAEPRPPPDGLSDSGFQECDFGRPGDNRFTADNVDAIADFFRICGGCHEPVSSMSFSADGLCG